MGSTNTRRAPQEGHGQVLDEGHLLDADEAEAPAGRVPGDHAVGIAEADSEQQEVHPVELVVHGEQHGAADHGAQGEDQEAPLALEEQHAADVGGEVLRGVREPVEGVNPEDDRHEAQAETWARNRVPMYTCTENTQRHPMKDR